MLPLADARPGRRSSAAERVADRRADLVQDVVADSTDEGGERLLGHGVDAIAVDDRGPIEPDLDVIDLDLRGEPSN